MENKTERYKWALRCLNRIFVFLLSGVKTKSEAEFAELSWDELHDFLSEARDELKPQCDPLLSDPDEN